VKWDGFRAIVSTEAPLGVRSRRGWDMTEQVGLLAGPPVRAVPDRQLVALDSGRTSPSCAHPYGRVVLLSTRGARAGWGCCASVRQGLSGGGHVLLAGRDSTVGDDEARWLLGQLGTAREFTPDAAAVAAKIEQAFEAAVAVETSLPENRS
jgi:hypothetical protein